MTDPYAVLGLGTEKAGVRTYRREMAGQRLLASRVSFRGSIAMTHTIVASATRTLVIGFDKPFCVIGERIHPTCSRDYPGGSPILLESVS